MVVMDGSSGMVIVNPDTPTIDAYYRESQEDFRAQKKYKKAAKKKTKPIGGKNVVIGANMGMLAHLQIAIDNGAEEIGLYRTEFPFCVSRGP
jgi:phosphoenolpyruvate-protein kinase (PTS system EI component)